ncbi:helix-turn-helix domain-containing protein [Parasutterella excrementihominis]|uniref:Helix-turn-helix domain-containing protein n=1 Tax=Parasutterella excrementihominis TaxID=487175 RepID=A0A844LGJ6_9BURK|nr:helix-turn-helix domain-containing protein [Parasutterella excrementihominis]MTU43893.1 helix-turn-helix domain-containing protein [Parasutterella excrementihominis]
MAGRTRKFNPVLSEQDKVTLEKIVASRTEEIRKVQRAKMILLAASGNSNTDIANVLGISRPVVNKIIKRFSSAGVQAAIEDAARPGRPSRGNLRRLEAKYGLYEVPQTQARKS